MIFVLKELRPAIKNVEVGVQNTGLARVGPNKGGQLIKFDIGYTTMCFFSAHLAAHQQHTKRRNEDVRDILRGCRAMDKRLDAPTQAHHSFFMGDMNYRIDPSLKGLPSDPKKRHDMQRQHVQSLIAQQRWQ